MKNETLLLEEAREMICTLFEDVLDNICGKDYMTVWDEDKICDTVMFLHNKMGMSADEIKKRFQISDGDFLEYENRLQTECGRSEG